jgi:hypothetical protein
MDKIILFKSNKCPACIYQMKLLKNKKKITMYDVDKKPVPDFIKDSRGNYSIPTWVIIKKGIINPTTMNKKKVTKNRFGLSEVGSLAKTGKNGIDVDKFNNGNANLWINQVKSKWGGNNYLLSGTYGRELGPTGDFSRLYSNSYTGNNLRMVRPGGPEDPMLNYNCNLMNNGNKTLEMGLYGDSKNSFKYGSSKKKYMKDYLVKPKKIDKIMKSLKKKKDKIKEGTTIILKRKKNGKQKIKVKN